MVPWSLVIPVEVVPILAGGDTNGAVSVANAATCTGCGFTSTYGSMTDLGLDAGFVRAPVRSSRANSGTVSTLAITNASSFFAVNDVIEIQDDGVGRAVSAVTSTQVTFAPALSYSPPANVRVDNWGAAPASLSVDLRLQNGSVCVDSGDNAAVPADVTDLDGDANVTEPVPVDFAGNARFVDDPSANTGNGTPPYVDIGAFER